MSRDALRKRIDELQQAVWRTRKLIELRKKYNREDLLDIQQWRKLIRDLKRQAHGAA